MSMEFVEFAQKNLLTELLQAECRIVGLGVDPQEGLESVFLQRVLCMTTRSQHLCHRGMRDHCGMLRTHVTGKASS